MRTDTPLTIYRKDYTAPSYLVDTVELGFDLDPARTVVASRLTLHRNPDGADHAIELVGEDIELVAIRMNGKGLHGSSASLSRACCACLGIST